MEAVPESCTDLVQGHGHPNMSVRLWGPATGSFVTGAGKSGTLLQGWQPAQKEDFRAQMCQHTRLDTYTTWRQPAGILLVAAELSSTGC